MVVTYSRTLIAFALFGAVVACGGSARKGDTTGNGGTTGDGGIAGGGGTAGSAEDASAPCPLLDSIACQQRSDCRWGGCGPVGLGDSCLAPPFPQCGGGVVLGSTATGGMNGTGGMAGDDGEADAGSDAVDASGKD